MKKAKLPQSVQIEFWQCLSDLDRERLSFAASVLVACESCAGKLLQEAREETQSAQVPPEFAYSFAMRVVVRLAIRHCQQPARACEQEEMRESRRLPLQDHPWAERVAYFLGDVLGYSRRDAALLLGMCDAHVDQLSRMARKRGAVLESLGDGTGLAPRRTEPRPDARDEAHHDSPRNALAPAISQRPALPYLFPHAV